MDELESAPSPAAKPKRRSFVLDVMTLVGGTFIGQLIVMFTAPIITRLYGAEAYGLAALFSSLVLTISVVACLRYEVSVMLPKTDGESANMLAASTLICAIISLSLMPIVWLFGDDLASFLNAPDLRPFLWLLPPMVFLMGWFTSMYYWNSRKRDFKRLSTNQIAKSASGSGIQLAGGLAGHATGGVMIGAVIAGQVVATSHLAYNLWRSDRALLKASVTWSGMKTGLRTYKDLARYDVWTALINAISLQLPIFILSAFFTTSIVGYYSLGLNVLQLPLNLVGMAIAQVFFQRAAEAHNHSRENLTSVVESTVGRLTVIGFPILFITFMGEDLFVILFGSAWAEAGVYTQLLSLFALTSFVFAPVSTLFTVQQKLKTALLFNIVMIASRAAPLIWGGINDNVYLGLLLMSLLGGLTYILASYWIVRKASASVAKIAAGVWKQLLIGIVMLVTIGVAKYSLAIDSHSILALSIAGALLYYALMVRQDREIRTMITDMMPRSSKR